MLVSKIVQSLLHLHFTVKMFKPTFRAWALVCFLQTLLCTLSLKHFWFGWWRWQTKRISLVIYWCGQLEQTARLLSFKISSRDSWCRWFCFWASSRLWYSSFSSCFFCLLCKDGRHLASWSPLLAAKAALVTLSGFWELGRNYSADLSKHLFCLNDTWHVWHHLTEHFNFF